jgi:hypothetical protein
MSSISRGDITARRKDVKKFLEFFKGKKTNIVGVGIGITATLYATGMIYEPTAQALLTILGGGAVMTLRDAIKTK